MNKLLIGIALLNILVLSGCQEQVCPECEVCEECPTCEVCEECPTYETCEVYEECPTCEVCEECPTYETCEVYEECPKEKALIDVQVTGWWLNEYDENEIFFEMYVYNYGNVEIKDITVECTLSDDRNNLLIKQSKYIGNIASVSINYKEILTKTPIEIKKANYGEMFWTICYIKSCSNCEILYKRIPELVETIEG